VVQGLAAGVVPEDMLKTFHIQPIFQRTYEEEEERIDAWEETHQLVRELLEDYKGQINLHDDGESITVSIEYGAMDPVVESSEAQERG
jgi:hypothetical protein